MTHKIYNTKGPVFKLALELGKNAEELDMPSDSYKYVLARLPEKAGKKTTMARVRKLVESGTYAWCAYSERPRGKDGVEGWIVGASGTGADWVCFSAPHPDKLEEMRQGKMLASTLAGAGKKPVPKTLVKSLVEAMRSGDRKTVEELAPVAARGTFEEKEPYGSDFETKRPMLVAALLDDPSMIGLLAPHADINTADEHGRTALFHAAGADKLPNAKFLLEAGADALLSDKNRTTPLMQAARKSRSMVELLLPHSDANAVDSQGRNALMTAVDVGLAENVEALCPATRLDTRDNTGITALMMSINPDAAEASRYNDQIRNPLRCAEILCKASGDIDAVDSEGNTALMRLMRGKEWKKSAAPSKQSHALAKMLLAANADPGKIYANGDSLLTFAARHELTTYFDLLLPLLDVRHAGERGDTALILSARNCDLEQIRAISAKSDARAANHEGDTALLACFGRAQGDFGRTTERILAFLHLLPLSDVNAQGAQGQTVLMKLVLAEQPELFALVLPGAAIDLQDANGMNALMHAARAKSSFFFDRLVSMSDLSAKDAAGKTALMHAIDAKEPGRIAALLSGSDVDCQDHEGRTALMHAVNRYKMNSSEAIVRLLLEVADAGLKDKDGRTAAELAREHENEAAAHLIAGVAEAQRESAELEKIASRPKKDGATTKDGKKPPRVRSRSI